VRQCGFLTKTKKHDIIQQVKLTIGERLKDLRTAQKLTLEQLAAEVGISKSALGKYESDNGKDISPYSILVLADY